MTEDTAKAKIIAETHSVVRQILHPPAEYTSEECQEMWREIVNSVLSHYTVRRNLRAGDWDFAIFYATGLAAEVARNLQEDFDDRDKPLRFWQRSGIMGR